MWRNFRFQYMTDVEKSLISPHVQKSCHMTDLNKSEIYPFFCNILRGEKLCQKLLLLKMTNMMYVILLFFLRTAIGTEEGKYWTNRWKQTIFWVPTVATKQCFPAGNAQSRHRGQLSSKMQFSVRQAVKQPATHKMIGKTPTKKAWEGCGSWGHGSEPRLLKCPNF